LADMNSDIDNRSPGHRVIFQPMGISTTVPDGQTIAAAAAAAGIGIRSECGGKGLCGKCLVEVAPLHHTSALTENESSRLSAEKIGTGGRLACEAKITGPLSVYVNKSVLDSEEAVGKSLSGTIQDEGEETDCTGTDGNRICGIAIDIGTTTLALYLCDLHTGEVMCSAARANPQRHFGEDVISRIAWCNDHGDGLEQLRSAIIDGINELISQTLGDTGVQREAIARVTVVGNTTMQHLFAGSHPGILGTAPFMPESSEARIFKAAELGLALSESCRLFLFPVISGFIGGDTVGVILSEKPYIRDEISLIIDLGTNGEVVLGNRDSLWATSCATGPALEGAHIEYGMRASTGAIEKVEIDPARYRVSYQVIGDETSTRPRGLCGSGIIDAVAGMLKAGLITPSGRLKEGLPGVRVDEQGIGREFVLVPRNDSSQQHPIVLTLQDVRQVQLAKAALSAGIKLLMKNAGIDKIDRLVLTGAFGARFNWKNAVAIGMLPEQACQASVSVVENAAGRGAVLALVDEREEEAARKIAPSVQRHELADDPEFALEFTRQVSLTGGASQFVKDSV